MAKRSEAKEKINNDLANLKQVINEKEPDNTGEEIAAGQNSQSAEQAQSAHQSTDPQVRMQDGKTPEDHPHYKYAETLAIYDTKTGRVDIVSQIDPTEGTVKTVEPNVQNRPAFFKVTDPNMVGNFISNFTARFQNTQWHFFVTPFDKVSDITAALGKFFQNSRDQDARATMNKYRVTTASLEKIKFNKEEIPWTQLSPFISREEAEKDPALIKSMMEGTPIEQLFDIEHKVSDTATIKGKVGIELYRDVDGLVKANLVTPLPQPEYLEPRYAAQLSQEDVKQVAEGGTVKRLLFNEKGEMCFGCVNAATNRFHFKPKDEVQIPNFINGKGLTPEQKQEAAYGREFFMENCKVYNQENTFSGKVSYDIKTNNWITRDPVYARPNVPDFVRQQLTSEQYHDLVNYRQIDASNIKKRDGVGTYKVMHIDQRTNNLSYFPLRNQQQGQSQQQPAPGQGQNGNSQQPGQAPPMPSKEIPDYFQNDQAQGRGRSKNTGR